MHIEMNIEQLNVVKEESNEYSNADKAYGYEHSSASDKWGKCIYTIEYLNP